MRRSLISAVGLVVLFSTAAAFAQSAGLSLRLTPPVALDDANRGVWRVVVRNDAATPQNALPLLLVVSFGTIAGLPPGAECATAFFDQARCTIDVPASGVRELLFTAQYQSRFGHFPADAETGVVEHLVEQQEAVFAHSYFVTNAQDDGPGSLRQAIFDINRDCGSPNGDPCGVEFRIDDPLPEEGWFTIRPRSPLPVITAYDAVVDGSTQSRYTGVTNPQGRPEIMLDGSDLDEGHGLEFRCAYARATDLAVGGFPGNGIESMAQNTTVLRNYLGVDPSGLAAAANGLRGVQIEDGVAVIEENVLSGNRRSGAFFVTRGGVTARRNLVGVGRDGVTPLGNGASGLAFIRPDLSYGVAVENIIANNEHFGIALALGATGNFAANTIRNNRGGAIDIGLDGPTLETRHGIPGQGGVLGAPSITSARFEDGATSIEGQIAPRPDASLTMVNQYVYVYANKSLDALGRAEAEEIAGVVKPDVSGRFSLRVDRDLRGSYISAAHFCFFVYGTFDEPAPATSEIGLPLRVE